MFELFKEPNIANIILKITLKRWRSRRDDLQVLKCTVKVH